MQKSEPVWLNLTDAARKLGVHATTLRRWADEGAIPVMLTPGGHRRFALTDLEEFLRTQRRAMVPPNPAQAWAERALTETRKEITAHQNAPWVASFNAEEREQSRQMGRRLMALLLQYLSTEDDAADLLGEAHAIGLAYAESTLGRGMPLPDAIQAMFFFRDMLTETAVNLPATASPRPEANVRLMRRINGLLNQVQLAIVEAYEQPRLGRSLL